MTHNEIFILNWITVQRKGNDSTFWCCCDLDWNAVYVTETSVNRWKSTHSIQKNIERPCLHNAHESTNFVLLQPKMHQLSLITVKVKENKNSWSISHIWFKMGKILLNMFSFCDNENRSRSLKLEWMCRPQQSISCWVSNRSIKTPKKISTYFKVLADSEISIISLEYLYSSSYSNFKLKFMITSI